MLRKITIGLALGLPMAAHAVPLYTAVDIGVIGTNMSVSGLNDSGVVVGTSQTNGQNQAFTYSNGQVTWLGAPTDGASQASGINASGAIAGLYQQPNTSGYAAVYSNGSFRSLGTLGGTGEGNYSLAEAINDSGVTVGYSTTSAHSNQHAFSYYNGVMTDIGTLAGQSGYSQAFAVNASAQIVGSSSTSTNETHAFIYSNGTMTDLGTFGGSSTYSSATGINASGTVVGTAAAATGSGMHAFAYKSGVMTDLGTIGGGAYSFGDAVNSAGSVVGAAYDSAFNQVAFLYAPDTNRMYDVNTLLLSTIPTTLTEAIAINSSGQMISTAANGHAYLLTASNVSLANQAGTGDVPEPGRQALAMGLLGLAALGTTAWRGHRRKGTNAARAA